MPSFASFSKRGDLVQTFASKIVRACIVAIAGGYIVVDLLIIGNTYTKILHILLHVLASLVLYPIAVVIFSIIPVSLLLLLKLPIDRQKLRKATLAFAGHPGTVIAVAGSYGKTSMKELLASLLASKFKARSTVGNKNTLMSLASFGLGLKGDEDYLIVEYGEGAPGDIDRMVKLTQPDFAVITGLAPNHLDRYGSIDEISKDFAVLADYTGVDNTFMNADSNELFTRLGVKGRNYTSDGGFDGWTVLDIRVAIDSLYFELEKCGKKIKIKSNLVGEHNVGPLSFVAGFCVTLGIDNKSIESAISKLEPYEHRMEPRRMHGAWFIDDTYNGNIDGMMAGLKYLKDIKVPGRKIYVTPGLVDQGAETEHVHEKLGQAIAGAAPGQVYLMRNSAQPIIENGMKDAGFSGRLTIVDDPLSFYLNVQDVLATGDVMLCQNDLPDRYQ